MKVAFRLRRRQTPEPASACVVFSHDLDELFRVIRADRGAGELPTIYPLADGFLVRLVKPTKDIIPGAQRLRALADHFYLPVDADLSPALLVDEARGLVRERGLVFLADGRILSFDPVAPLTMARMVVTGEVRRLPWRALPEAPPRVERIASIVLELPRDEPEAILDSPDIGREQPRPADSSLPAKVLGQAAIGLGKTLFGLGKLLGLQRLANAGANWIERGLSLAPRLSESLLNKQEAALRELLRWFRAGDLEEALRRALPLGGAEDRGGVAATDSRLPTHNLFYSLANLLGGGWGIGSIWYGGGNVQAELAQEYRKAATKAVAHGDHRRAAFIYGKLLRDYRSAANVLMQGGLFHDAAILFLKKLDDRRSAARAFDAAGEYDRAVQLFHQLGDHLAAGDLLRRIGETEAALQEYECAVAELVQRHDYLAAADVMLSRAHRPERGRDYLRLGWERRPATNAVACAILLAKLHARAREVQSLRGLVVEARVFFTTAARDNDGVQFFNTVAVLAHQQGIEEARDDLRDHALLGLAGMLGQCAAAASKPGDIVSSILGRSGAWSAPVVADAQFALRATLSGKESARENPRPQTKTTVRLGTGRLTAACQAPIEGDVFAGFLSGDVVCFRPTSGEVVRVKCGDGLHVTSLATDVKGWFVLVLQQKVVQGTDAVMRLNSYERRGDTGFSYLSRYDFRGSQLSSLLPVGVESHFGFGLCDGEKTQFLSAHLAAHAALDEPHFLVVPCPFPGVGIAMVNFCAGTAWCNAPFKETQLSEVRLGWKPSPAKEADRAFAPVSWLQYGSYVELAGLNEEGALYWSKLCLDEQGLRLVATNASTCLGGYQAAAIVKDGVVAGVRRAHIDWLRAGPQRFAMQSSTPLPLRHTVACFASHTTRELLVVSQKGLLERIHFPAAL